MQDTSQLKIRLTNRFQNGVWLIGWRACLHSSTFRVSSASKTRIPFEWGWKRSGMEVTGEETNEQKGRGVKDRARGCSSVVGWLCCTVRGGGEDVWAPCSSRVRKDRSTTSRSSSHLLSGAVHKLRTWRWSRHSEIKYLLIGLHLLLIKRGYSLQITYI